MAAGRVIYRHAVESFIKHVIDRHSLRTRELVVALAAHGVELDSEKDLLVEQMDRLIELTAERFSPGRPRAEVLEEMGREQLRGFAESLVGKSLFFVLRRFGVRRSMLRTAENFTTVGNFSTVEAREVGPTHLVLDMRPVSRQPTFVVGLLGESMRLLGVSEFSIAHEVMGDGDRYVIRW